VIDKDDYNQALNLTIIELTSVALTMLDNGTGKHLTHPSHVLSAIKKTAWELSRPDAKCVHFAGYNRVSEIVGVDRWREAGYDNPTLSAIYDENGVLVMVYGWCVKDGERVEGGREKDIFDAVQTVFDELVVFHDLRNEQGELLLSTSKANVHNKDMPDVLSDVVVKDIDTQVKEFTSELDSIFGATPTVWAPPEPPKGENTE
jgi:hypothetical protein